MTKEMEEIIERSSARASRNAVIYDESKVNRDEQLRNDNLGSVIRSQEDADRFMAEIEYLRRKSKENLT